MSAKPKPKVAAGGVAAAVAVLLIGVLERQGVKVSAVEAGAIVAVLQFVAAWVKRETQDA